MSQAGDRLARSRLAIIEQVQRREKRHERREAPRDRRREHDADGEPTADEAGGGAQWFDGVKHMASAWWRQHPARVGADLLTPVLSAYARRKPVQFIGIAVGLGALVAVARPWRLITVGGLLAAVLKSSQLSGLIVSAMSAADFRKDVPPYE